MRLKTRIGGFCLVLAILASLVVWPANAAALDKVKFGISLAHDIYFFPGFVAKDKGFWQANGIDVEIVYFKGGGDIITAAGAGKILIGTAPASTIAMAVMRGAPIKMVSTRAISGKGLCLIARNELKTWDDLKGKKIGITRFGGSLDFMIRKSLIKNGLDPEKDVSILPLGGKSANEAAFLTQKTDAFGWTLDVAKKFEKKYDTSTIHFNVSLPSGIFANNKMISEQPDLVKRVLKSWYQATIYMKENPEYTINAMAKEWGADPEDTKVLYMSTIDDLSPDGIISQEGLINTRESLKLRGNIKEEDIPSIEDFFTPQFVPVK